MTGTATGAPVRMLSTNLRISGRKKSMLSSSGSSENLFSSVRAKGVVKRLDSQVVQPALQPSRASGR